MSLPLPGVRASPQHSIARPDGEIADHTRSLSLAAVEMSTFHGCAPVLSTRIACRFLVTAPVATSTNASAPPWYGTDTGASLLVVSIGISVTPLAPHSRAPNRSNCCALMPHVVCAVLRSFQTTVTCCVGASTVTAGSNLLLALVDTSTPLCANSSVPLLSTCCARALNTLPTAKCHAQTAPPTPATSFGACAIGTEFESNTAMRVPPFQTCVPARSTFCMCTCLLPVNASVRTQLRITAPLSLGTRPTKPGLAPASAAMPMPSCANSGAPAAVSICTRTEKPVLFDHANANRPALVSQTLGLFSMSVLLDSVTPFAPHSCAPLGSMR